VDNQLVYVNAINFGRPRTENPKSTRYLQFKGGASKNYTKLKTPSTDEVFNLVELVGTGYTISARQRASTLAWQA
jgi:hypothetical protein